MANSDIAGLLIKVAIGLLSKGIAGDWALQFATDKAMELGGDEVKALLESILTNKEAAARLMEAGRFADRCFLENCTDTDLRGALSLPLGDLPEIQLTLSNLAKDYDETLLLQSVRQTLLRDFPTLTNQQVDAGVTAYVDCLSRALLPLKQFSIAIIGNALLDTRKEIRKLSFEQSTAFQRLQLQLQSRLRLSPQPKFLVPFAKNPHFVGRDETLQQLHSALARSHAVGVRPAMLTGLGGIGKTQLAVEYAFEFQSSYPGGVYWVNAAQDWQDELAAKAQELGITTDEVSESDRRRNLVQAFTEFLNSHPDALLIFDNVDDPRLLNAPVLGLVASQLKCRLLFTTRRRDTALQFSNIEVRSLPEGAAMKLLTSMRSDGDSLTTAQRDVAGTICRSLGYLPLALTLAAAYLGKYPRITLLEYLGRLEREGALKTVDAAGIDFLDLPTRHEAAVAATLRSQWNVIGSETARQTLQIASLLGEAAQVPRGRLALFTGLSDESNEGYPAPLDQALTILRSLSLIEELGDAEIRLHPLVAQFSEGTITEREMFAVNLARRVADTLWNVAYLYSTIVTRHVDSVLGDLRIAARLVLQYRNRDEDPARRLLGLLRCLDLEAHNFRRWDPERERVLFLQQLSNRAINLALNDLHNNIDQQLLADQLPYLREKFTTSPESPALVRTLISHTGAVTAVAVTPDEQLVVSGSEDGLVIIWELSTGQVRKTLSGHKSAVTCVAITPNGKFAITGSRDNRLIVWNIYTGEILHVLSGHENWVNSVAVTSDGRLVVSASRDLTLIVWGIETGSIRQTLRGHHNWVVAVSIVPNAHIALSGSYDHRLITWDLATGVSLHVFEGHRNWVRSVAVTADGRYAISASADHTLIVWDLNSGEAIRTLVGHNNWVNTVATTPDGVLAASGSADRTVRLWEISTGQQRLLLKGHTGSVTALAFAPNEKVVVSASEDATLRIWDIAVEASNNNVQGHQGPVRGVAIVADRSTGVSASEDGTLSVWDLITGKAKHTLTGHSNWVTAISVSFNGRVAISASYDNTLIVWDLTNGKAVRRLRGHATWVTAVAMARDGRIAISGSVDGSLIIWDLSDGKLLRIIQGHSTSITAIGIGRNGSTFLSASQDRTLKVWNMSTGQIDASLEGHERGITALAVSDNGEFALVASGDQQLRVWDLTKMTTKCVLAGHTADIRAVSITADGTTGVSVSADRCLRVWDVKAGRCLAFASYAAPLRSCAIASDGYAILVGDDVGAVHVLEFVNQGVVQN